MPSSVPVIDLTPWSGGDEAGCAAVAAEVDAALQNVGFLKKLLDAITVG
jgi:isopenicillin N synthase-like dioxygenase